MAFLRKPGLFLKMIWRRWTRAARIRFMEIQAARPRALREGQHQRYPDATLPRTMALAVAGAAHHRDMHIPLDKALPAGRPLASLNRPAGYHRDAIKC